MTTYFSFQLLDDLVDVQDRQRVANVIKEATVYRIAPLVEYVFLERLHSQYLPLLWDYCVSPAVQLLQRTIASPQSFHTTSLNPQPFEFFCFQNSIINKYLEYAPWIAFQKRFEYACLQGGISNKLAAGVTGAFGEMVDNVFIHSNNPTSIILGY